MRIRSCFFAMVFFAGTAAASVLRSIPVVAQVQGAAYYRTSITFSNGNPTITTPCAMLFSYRSPVDGTFQQTGVFLDGGIPPRRVGFVDDIVQAFKDSGAIRAEDADAALFGTLLVFFDALDVPAEAGAVARTYSAAPGGGTLGIAYAGRDYNVAGSLGRVLGSARGGVFGSDGSTRANLGIVNEGSGPSDVTVTYFDTVTGAQLKQFLTSSLVHHDLEENEVLQINNIFDDAAIPSNVHRLIVQVDGVSPDAYVSAYIVQLDNTSNDGSFFFLEEE